MPVTVYVRNLGPSTESFNTGFFLKSSSFNDPLGLGVNLVPAFTAPGSDHVTIGAVNVTEVSSQLNNCHYPHNRLVL